MSDTGSIMGPLRHDLISRLVVLVLNVPVQQLRSNRDEASV